MKGWAKAKTIPSCGCDCDRSKVQYRKEQYCIGTWNVRSMNQGKLEVVKKEMTRVHVNILRISKLKWTVIGEFNADDHYIFYWGQESLRRNGVAIMVNKRVQNAVLGCNLRNDKMISVRFQGKPFNITVIQVYAPTSNAEEAEIERFYEDLQDLSKVKPPKDVRFIIGEWNAKVGSQETPGVTGKFGLGIWNEAGQRLIQFCQENALVIANTLFQQHKEDSTHGHNQMVNIKIRLIMFSAAKDRDALYSQQKQHRELPVAQIMNLLTKFRLKLKKVGNTTRPLRYDLNQIAYDYTVEVRNRFKGRDLIDRVPDELWNEIRDIVQETGIKTTEKKCKNAKWLSGEALQIAVKGREAKNKGEKERYKHHLSGFEIAQLEFHHLH